MRPSRLLLQVGLCFLVATLVHQHWSTLVHTGPSRHSFVETTDEFSQEAKRERERERERPVNKSF